MLCEWQVKNHKGMEILLPPIGSGDDVIKLIVNDFFSNNRATIGKTEIGL